MLKDPYTDFAPTLSTAHVNGVTLRVAESGQGNPMLFLHGFPEHWGTWRRLMSHFESTNRVIAPDLRGYGRSSRPTELQAYATDQLIADVMELMNQLALQDVTIVGHDWGASLAFWAAMKDVSRIRRLVILNGVHPYLFQDRIWDDPDQRRASQYIKRLRTDHPHPWLCADNAQGIANEWLAPALRAGKIDPAEINEYLDLWSDPSAWPAMIKWYRAAPISAPGLNERAPKIRWTEGLDYSIPCPVHVIWGDRDPLFSFRLVEDLERHVDDLHVHRIPDAGHVPHRDAPIDCAKYIRAAMFG